MVVGREAAHTLMFHVSAAHCGEKGKREEGERRQDRDRTYHVHMQTTV